MKLPTRVSTPCTSGYRPELDISRELTDSRAVYFMSLIGILRWAVELGRIDIETEVSKLSSFLAAPREGHLSQALHIFAYLKKHHNSGIVFDPTYPDINEDDFKTNDDWKYFYGDEGESLPPNMPPPLGKEVVIRCFVDADHAGDKITRRSRTGFIIFINNAPIYWTSKKQNTCESSTFGSELVAMKTATEYLRGLRYKLRMMGIPLSGPAYVYGDNMSVIHNTTAPESTLKKKHNSIAYHFVREGVARGEWLVTFIKSVNNPADILTKSLPQPQREFLLKLFMHYIYD